MAIISDNIVKYMSPGRPCRRIRVTAIRQVELRGFWQLCKSKSNAK